jgi:uncharacterized protein YqhQ
MPTEKDKKKKNPINDKGDLFSRYKKNFTILFVIIAIFFVCFLLTSFNILPIWVTDIILIPIVLATILLWVKARRT